MSIDDNLPPHEVRGLLGQLGDAGGGLTPGLERPPLPYALANASPGLSTGAAAPTLPVGGGPTLPADDPTAMARVLAQLANEMFGGGGASLAPMPTPGEAPGALTSPQSAWGGGPAPAFPASFEPGGAAGFGVPQLDLPAPTPIDAPAAYAVPAQRPYEQPSSSSPSSSSSRATREAPVRDLGGTAFDARAIRKDFPILEERVANGKRLVWLDNGATTQKPRAVIDRLSYFYEHENSNIHRAAHTLAARASDAYEQARETTRKFLNAQSTSEIIFVRGATEGINLVAQSWGRRNIRSGDEIVITHLEHHANIVPWQMLCGELGAKLRVAPVDDRGDVILEAYERLLSSRTRLVAITQVSNALGTVTPTRDMVAIARRYGATVMIDGAQAVSHMPVDVQALDADFYVFSGHKVFAPTGIGVVYGKRAVLDAMPPWQGGGNMIADVTFERTVYQPPPARFEAGTGNIADAVGLGAALDYVMNIGMDVISRYEHELLVYATEELATVPGLHMIGTAREKAGVLSFVLDGQRTEDVGALLDKDGIAVRSGHHCAQPILRRFGLEASVRASLAFYNLPEEIDALVDALRRIQGGRNA